MTDKENLKEIEKCVNACVRNERRAQEHFYRMFFPVLAPLCYARIPDKEEAMEVLNVGFLKIFMNLASCRNLSSIESWMKTIIANCVRDHYRQVSRSRISFTDLETDRGYISGIEEKLFEEDLLQLIQTLPPVTRNVFVKFAVEGFSHSEISEQMKMSVGTSKWHVSTARKLLKNKIGESTKLENNESI